MARKHQDNAPAEAESTTTVEPSGYSGSGSMSDLLNLRPSAVAKGTSRAEREAAIRQAEDAKQGKAFADQIAEASAEIQQADSKNPGWVEYAGLAEEVAKRLRRLVNAASAEADYNLSVVLEDYVTDIPSLNEAGEPELDETGEPKMVSVTLWSLQARRQRSAPPGGKKRGRKPASETAQAEDESTVSEGESN